MSGTGDDEHIYAGGYVVLPFDPSVATFVSKHVDTRPSGLPSGNEEEEDQNLTPLFDAVFPVISQCIKAAVSQCLSFLYILYPVSHRDPSWLLSNAHCNILFQLYSAASAAAFESTNPTLDIRVLPMPLQPSALHHPSVLPQPLPSPLLSPLQIQTLHFLLRIDDPIDSRFVERRQPDGPVVCYACPPPVWHAALRRRSSSTGEEQEEEEESPPPNQQPPSSSSSLDELPQEPIGEGLELRTDEDASDLPEEVRRAEFISTIFLRELLATTGDMILKVVEFDESFPRQKSVLSRETVERNNCRQIMQEEPVQKLQEFETTLIGGTFDHLHPGHKYLLSLMALMTRRRICVGMSADDATLLVKKQGRQLLQPLIVRANRLSEFVESLLCLLGRPLQLILPKDVSQLTPAGNPPDTHGVPVMFPSLLFSSRPSLVYTEAVLPPAPRRLGPTASTTPLTELEIVVIYDHLGPAADRQDFECLVVTAETRAGGARVNRTRIENGLSELTVVELPMVPSREIIVPDETIKDARLKDPTLGAPRSPLPAIPAASLALDLFPSSEGGGTPRSQKSDKTSSTYIRESVGEQPTMQRLSHFWSATASTLRFPPLFASAWGIRLLECYSAPWRRANRARLVLAMEKVWDQAVCISAEKPLSLETRGWIAVVLWLSLVAASSHSLVGEDLTTENILSRAKCCRLFQLFCSDLYVTGWLLPPAERLPLRTLWRADERQSITEEDPVWDSEADFARHPVVPPPRKVSSIVQPWVADIGRDPEKDRGTTSLTQQQRTTALPPPLQEQHNRLASGWLSSFAFLDLYNNLREASLYLVDAFVPKHHRSDYLEKPVSAAALYVRPVVCPLCFPHRRNGRKQTAEGLLGHAISPTAVKRSETLARIDQSTKDFLGYHIRIFDLFTYLFFHDSHRTSLASSSILRMIDELKPQPVDSSPQQP